MDDHAVREQISRLEGLLAELEERADQTALAAVRALLEVYGEAFARIMAQITDDAAAEAYERDELVSHLMVLHDVRPRRPDKASTAFIPLADVGRPAAK